MASKLFTAGQIGTLTLPNRVIRSATQDPFGRRDGTCAPEQVELYREIAAAGTGAIITAYSPSMPSASRPFPSAMPSATLSSIRSASNHSPGDRNTATAHSRSSASLARGSGRNARSIMR